MSYVIKLHEAIEKVCPIHGVSPMAGRIDFAEGATDAQKKAALEILKNFDRDKAMREVAIVSARKAEYPDIGDQLDAIMKWLATETEMTVPAELKSIAMKCMSVKAKYPKGSKND